MPSFRTAALTASTKSCPLACSPCVSNKVLRAWWLLAVWGALTIPVGLVALPWTALSRNANLLYRLGGEAAVDGCPVGRPGERRRRYGMGREHGHAIERQFLRE